MLTLTLREPASTVLLSVQVIWVALTAGLPHTVEPTVTWPTSVG